MLSSVKGPGEPLLVLGSENRRGLLLAGRGRNQAHEPHDEEQDPSRQDGEPAQDGDEHQDDPAHAQGDAGHNQTQTLPQVEGTQGGLFAAVNDDRDDEADDRLRASEVDLS